MAEITRYREGLSYNRVQRLGWKLYRRLPPAMAGLFKGLRPRFADEEGRVVAWFGLHCVQRREGGGFVAVGDNARIEGTLIATGVGLELPLELEHRSAVRLSLSLCRASPSGTIVSSLTMSRSRITTHIPWSGNTESTMS